MTRDEAEAEARMYEEGENCWRNFWRTEGIGRR